MNDFEKKYQDCSLPELGREFVKLRERHTELKEQAAKIWHEVDYLRFTAIPDTLEAEGIESLKVDDVGRISTRVESSVKTIDKERLRQWLINNDGVAMISETINSSSLKAFIMNRVRDGQDIPGDEIIEFKPFVVATITKG